MPDRKEILQAVARGWCSKENENKIVDPILGQAITDEICKTIGIKAEIPYRPLRPINLPMRIV